MFHFLPIACVLIQYADMEFSHGTNIDHVRSHWYAGDHDFPPEAREAAVEWFKQWFLIK